MSAANGMLKRVALILMIATVTTIAPRGQTPAIRIVLLGTGGGPHPTPGLAGPSALVEAGSERLFVDVGRGAFQRLQQAGLAASAPRRVFLTHLHSDHVVGLPELWLSGSWLSATAPFEVRGPSGTRAMTEHLRRAFTADLDIRSGAPERLPRETRAIRGFDVGEGVVYEANGVRVSAIRVDHGPVPTFGYRIDHAGRSVVFSGDDRRSENLIAKAQNVDVLFHNMTGFTAEQIQDPGPIGERRRAALELLGTPEDAAAVFTRSRCKVAILIHATSGPLSLQRVRAAFQGRIEVPDDLSEVLIGDEVIVRPLKR